MAKKKRDEALDAQKKLADTHDQKRTRDCSKRLDICGRWEPKLPYVSGFDVGELHVVQREAVAQGVHHLELIEADTIINFEPKALNGRNQNRIYSCNPIRPYCRRIRAINKVQSKSEYTQHETAWVGSF